MYNLLLLENSLKSMNIQIIFPFTYYAYQLGCEYSPKMLIHIYTTCFCYCLEFSLLPLQQLFLIRQSFLHFVVCVFCFCFVFLSS